MKTEKVYIVDGEGNRITVEVSKEVAEAMQECRKAEWRNDSIEMYYRDKALGSLNALSDGDKEIAGPDGIESDDGGSAERFRRDGIKAVLRSLTNRQKEVVRLLYKGKSVTEAARILGITHQSVGDIKKIISKKLEKFLK